MVLSNMSNSLSYLQPFFKWRKLCNGILRRPPPLIALHGFIMVNLSLVQESMGPLNSPQSPLGRSLCKAKDLLLFRQFDCIPMQANLVRLVYAKWNQGASYASSTQSGTIVEPFLRKNGCQAHDTQSGTTFK